jgi:hypothetical protein
MATLTKNNSNMIFKVETTNHLEFSVIEKLSQKYSLMITDHNGDFLTLTNKNGEGLQVMNVTSNNKYNKWMLYSKNSNSINTNFFNELQVVFNELVLM